MKTTVAVRKVDSLGRIVIPMQMRKILDIPVGEPMEMFYDKDRMVIRKYKPEMTCLVTGITSDDNFQLADGKIILSKAGMEMLLQLVQRELQS